MRATNIVLGLLLTGCVPLPGPHVPGDTDAGEPVDAGYVDGNPFGAPSGTWRYVPLPETRCAIGTSTGVAVNVSPGSDELVLYLQGGGACWEASACLYGLDGKGTASHLKHTVGESIVMQEATTPHFFFDRTQEQNPFRDAHYLYVPYCTGDMHAGDREKGYQDAFGNWVTVHHKGGHNVQVLLEKLREELPDLQRIRLVGVSAGGYGATLNWWRVRQAYPDAVVDVLNDSGPPIRMSGGQYGTLRNAWNLQMPPDCTECDKGFPAWLEYYRQTVPEPHRYALLVYRQDEVVRTFFGYLLDIPAYEARLDDVLDALGPRQKAYVLPGAAHVMLAFDPLPTNANGVSLLEWIRAFAAHDPAWDHEP